MSRSMAVVGGGTMGVGIAYVFAQGGFQTWLVEPSVDRTSAAKQVLVDAAADGERRGRLTAEDREGLLERIRYVRDVADLPADLAVIVESVPERVDLKREVLLACEERRPRVLASNTSSLSIDDLASALGRPDCFLGMHFFNPVWSLQLVEVVNGAATDAATLDEAIGLVDAIGKKVAVVNDSPGFATSRLDLVAGLEAMRMVQDGVATAEDIDRAITLAYRHPVGPLRLSDLVGLDVRLDIARQLSSTLGSRFDPPRILIDLVAAGHLGKKTGKGFYEW